MRVIIVGVGGVGAMAAWQLARAGVEVIGLEQFDVDHDRGSSYGDSRIVRRVYPDTLYTQMMAGAYTLWDQLQDEYQFHDRDRRELMTRSGGIFFGSGDDPQVNAARAALEISGVDHELLNAAETMRRFPAFRMASDEIALFEPSMGYARPSRSVTAAVRLAEKMGAKIVPNCRVTALERIRHGVKVTTQTGDAIDGDRLLLCAGPWTGAMLRTLGLSVPLTVTRQSYIHLEPEAGCTDDFGQGSFPVWIDATQNSYGFPILGDVPGVKIGLHDHGVATTPETVDREVTQVDIDKALAYANSRFRGLSTNVVYDKVCLYTNTPDEDFIVDVMPNLPEAMFVTACSGHGFKFTPLLGKIVADTMVGHPIGYDLSRFRMSRF